MPRSHRPLLLACLAAAGLGAGCAAVAPSQLVTARDGYARSSAGAAARWSPVELADGKKMLDRANLEFEARGDTSAVRDYAYIAGRKFQLADARARNELDRQRGAEATAEGIAVRDEQAQRSQEALDRTRGQLRRERNASDAATLVLQAARAGEAPPPAEPGERTPAGARQSRSMEALAFATPVHQEARGVVITLDEGRLFAFGSAELLTSASAGLDQLAAALREQPPEQRMAVESHTDSLGPELRNLDLSRRRAGAVRDALITRGVAPGRLTATGLGSSRPLMDNASPEHRARNRRVEIVLHGGGVTSRDLTTPHQEP